MTKTALQRMVELMEKHPEVGIAGCRLELEDGSFDHAAKRSFPTPISALAHFTGVGRRFGANARLASYRARNVESRPVDAVNGAFMLMRRVTAEPWRDPHVRFFTRSSLRRLCRRHGGWATPDWRSNPVYAQLERALPSLFGYRLHAVARRPPLPQ